MWQSIVLGCIILATGLLGLGLTLNAHALKKTIEEMEGEGIDKLEGIEGIEHIDTDGPEIDPTKEIED